MYYYTCSICGNLHDDGALITYKDKKYNVCMDCSEKENVKELLKNKIDNTHSNTH